jgi:hypothetical protein
MSKDLVRGTNVTKSEQTKTERTRGKQTEVERAKTERMRGKQTEVERAQEAFAERMLFGTSSRPQDAGVPSIILAFDGTVSMGEYIEERRITLEAARSIACSLFAEQAGLRVRLAFFRGDGDKRSTKHPRQLQFSKEWYREPEKLARHIAAIEHWPGWTQHCRLLRLVAEEAEKQAIQQVVIISDAFERRTPLRPDGDDLMAARVHAARLRDLGVKLVVGYKGTVRGGCPLDRAGVNAEHAFRHITRENGGYVFLFDPATVADRFAEIATQATLTAKGDAVGAQKLIEHMQTFPLEMVVQERVPSTRCAARSEESEE